MEDKLAILQKNITEEVDIRLKEYVNTKQLVIPDDYDIESAMDYAWEELQNVEDIDHRQALTICTKDSIVTSLLNMVVLGLNPAESECYFIVLHNKLLCQVSCAGIACITKRVANIKQFWVRVVYEDDEFEYTLSPVTAIIKLSLKLANVKRDKIAAACAVVEWNGDKKDTIEIMTIDEIKKGWAHSKEFGFASSHHNMWPDQMAIRMIANRICKPIINSSSDNELLKDAFYAVSEEI
ncbi:recombinase RecT [Chloroflexota bacterium]